MALAGAHGACAEPAAVTPSPGLRPGTIVIEPARRRAREHLGFGWSRREPILGRWARWISHLEADVWFVPQSPVTDMVLCVSAAPLYLDWKRQNIGVFINNRFLGEWLCPDSPGFREYRMTIPAQFLTPSTNRLTLRMGYRRRIRPDRRELSLAVERIVFAPIAPSAGVSPEVAPCPRPSPTP